MTRVMLTGVSGFVGSNLFQYLGDNTDWKISCMPTPTLMHDIPEPSEPFDFIIHLASASSVEASFKNPKRFIKRNIESTLNVLEYARKHPGTRLLHMSSVEAVAPSNPYAGSKAAQEALVRSYAISYGISSVILRAGNIIGPGQSPDKFIPKLVSRINGYKEVEIYITEEGTIGARKYIHVSDVCNSIFKTITSPVEGIVTLEGIKLIDNLDMARQIAEKLGKPLHYKLVKPEARPSYAAQFKTDSISPIKPKDEDPLSWIK